MTRKIILSDTSPPLQSEPPLDPPEACPTKRKLIRDYPKEERLDQFFKRYVNIIPEKELDIHPEMEDNPSPFFPNDSKGG